MTMPNTEATLFYPDIAVYERPELWAWIKAKCLHVQRNDLLMGWDIWFAVSDQP